MQTNILLVVPAEKAVTEEMKTSLINYVGTMNVDTECTYGPFVCYKDLLQDDAKEHIRKHMIEEYRDIIDVLFVEYDPFEKVTSTLIYFHNKE